MAFTEFYVQTTGSDLNSGSTTSDSASVTSTNGDWNQTTANRFIAASGTPFSGVSVGDWASIYLDAATTTTLIGRVTAINGGGASIDISTTARSGSTTAGSTGRTCKIGGAWATIANPLAVITGAATNSSGDVPRVNIKSGTTYNITSSSAITTNQTGPLCIQGYTSSPGDGGRATIDGGSSGSSYVLFTVGASSTFAMIKDLIFQNNGATGSARGVSVSSGGARAFFDRCTVTAVRGAGFYSVGAQITYSECEAYGCNTSGTFNEAGFYNQGLTSFYRCLSYSNSTGQGCGFTAGSNTVLVDCISSSNAYYGLFSTASGVFVNAVNCTFYGNGIDGIRQFSQCSLYIENCLLEANAGYGINSVVTTGYGFIRNCAFYNNTSGPTNSVGNFQVSGSVTLSSSGVLSASTGNFTPNNPSILTAGRGTYTNSNLAATPLSYPVIGAVENLNSVIVSPPRRVV